MLQVADDYDIAHADLIIEASVTLGAPDAHATAPVALRGS
jgi:hypothetical protein